MPGRARRVCRAILLWQRTGRSAITYSFLPTNIRGFRGSIQAQAQELADYFSSLPKEEQPTAIFSSPYCEYSTLQSGVLLFQVVFSDRCLQTAKPVAIALNIPIYVEHGKP